MANPYSVLGIRPTATPEEVKAAFRKMAMRYHPDRTGGDAKAAERMAEVNAAYDRLRKAEVSAEDGPPNPTTYMRLLSEREREVLDARAEKLRKKAQMARKLHRLKSPFAKAGPGAACILLSAIHIEDEGLKLIFDGFPQTEADQLILPSLRYHGKGHVSVNAADVRVMDAPACPARASTIYVKDAATFVDAFDGVLHLHFDT